MSINLKIEDVCIQLGIDIHKFNLENPEIKTEPEAPTQVTLINHHRDLANLCHSLKSDRCHMTI